MKTSKRILILKLLVASLLTTMIASLFSTQRVIRSLNEIGGKVELGDRASMTVYDATHFGPVYWVFISIAFLIAFTAAWCLYKRVKFGRPIIFTMAGIAAMFVMLLAMEKVFFGVPIVAGARDGVGLVLQILAGGIGGFLFARLTTPKAIKKGAPKERL